MRSRYEIRTCQALFVAVDAGRESFKKSRA
jgi:hypothetical protein